MNSALVLAAGLMVILGAAHSYLGERYILMRLFRRTDLPRLFGSDAFTRRTLRFAWHVTTVAWWGLAALLFVVARSVTGVTVREIGVVVAATSFASAVVIAVGSRGRHAGWVVFFVIGALTLFGTR